MVTPETESYVRAILYKHLDAATNEIAETGDLDMYWPDGCVERLAEIITHTLCLTAESLAAFEDGKT